MSLKGYAIILGAGASKGARVGTVSPPLDAEFFATAKHEFSKRGPNGSLHERGSKAWKKFYNSIKQAGLRKDMLLEWRLEEATTYLEARTKMNSLQTRQGQPKKFRNLLEDLKRAICYVLAKTNGDKKCSLHRKLFELTNPESVITFNYDLIADSTLMQMGRLSWTRKEYSGYGGTKRFPMSVYAEHRRANIRYVKPTRIGNAIHLLKLHGSMHWERNQKGGKHRLAVAALPSDFGDFRFDVAPTRPLIVPPLAAKMEIRETALKHLWVAARKRLSDAPGWIIWGYSFPQTDTVAMVLFRTALELNKRPKPVIVINPDKGAAERIRKYLRKVRVHHFASIEKFLLDHRVSLEP